MAVYPSVGRRLRRRRAARQPQCARPGYWPGRRGRYWCSAWRWAGRRRGPSGAPTGRSASAVTGCGSAGVCWAGVLFCCRQKSLSMGGSDAGAQNREGDPSEGLAVTSHRGRSAITGKGSLPPATGQGHPPPGSVSCLWGGSDGEDQLSLERIQLSGEIPLLLWGLEQLEWQLCSLSRHHGRPNEEGTGAPCRAPLWLWHFNISPMGVAWKEWDLDQKSAVSPPP